LLAAYATATQIGAKVAGVYVFGSPPVGNDEWENAYNPILKNVTFDYMIKGDWVSFLPLKCFGYRSVGCETIRLEIPSYFPSFIHNHLPWQYVAALRKST